MLSIIGTLFGAFFGYKLTERVSKIGQARLSYEKFVTPLSHSIKDLDRAILRWGSVVKQVQFPDKSEDMLSDTEKKILEVATIGLDNQSLDFIEKLEDFNASIARSVIEKIDKI